VRYGTEVREALVGLREASDRLCSKRLKPLIPILLPALERLAGSIWMANDYLMSDSSPAEYAAV
jgi:hypothetical protein